MWQVGLKKQRTFFVIFPFCPCTFPEAPCASCGFERQEGNEAQVAGGGTTKVPCTSVFLCMCVDDQSLQCARARKDSDSRRDSLHLFLCASEGVCDQSTCAERLLIRLTPKPGAAPLGDCG